MPITSSWTDPNSNDLTTGQVLTQTVWEQVLGDILYLGGTTGAFANWTPTITQSGTLTLSTAIGRYIQIGKVVIATVKVTINSTGTTANGIVLGGLPFTLSANSAGPFFGQYSDASVPTVYQVIGIPSGTSIALYGGNGSAALGVGPAFAAAASDTLVGTVIGELA